MQFSSAIQNSETAIVNNIPTGSERILFVDDDAVQVEIGCEMLRRLGYQVAGVPNSLDALNRFRDDPGNYDLVVSDIAMPELTGEGLTREILSIRPQMPVILATGYSDRVNESRARAIGARDLMFKPVSMLHLAKTVRRVLDEVFPG